MLLKVLLVCWRRRMIEAKDDPHEKIVNDDFG